MKNLFPFPWRRNRTVWKISLFCVCAGLAAKSVFRIGQSSFFNYRGAEMERGGKFPCFASAQDWRISLFSKLVNQVFLIPVAQKWNGVENFLVLRLCRIGG